MPGVVSSVPGTSHPGHAEGSGTAFNATVLSVPRSREVAEHAARLAAEGKGTTVTPKPPCSYRGCEYPALPGNTMCLPHLGKHEREHGLVVRCRAVDGFTTKQRCENLAAQWSYGRELCAHHEAEHQQREQQAALVDVEPERNGGGRVVPGPWRGTSA